MTFFSLLQQRFAELEAELNRLDAATGDGDHGSTMVKGLRAAAEAAEADGGEGAGAKAFRGAAGGASGSLFGVVLGELETWLAAPGDLAAALETAAGKVQRLGQATQGDKTMLDALIPAALGAAGAASPSAAARAATEGAAAGAQETTAMCAKRGRARYVENGGQGHLDAGARSIAEILGVLAKFMESRT